MRKSRLRSLPSLKSLDELVEFFDTSDLGSYELPQVQCDVDIHKRTYLVAVDAKLVNQLTRIARAQRMSCEGLIYHWLREKIRESQRSEASAAPKRRD